MKLADFAKLCPEIGRHIRGLTPENALKYIGKDSDKPTAKDLLERGGEVAHSSMWGGLVSDRLRTVNESAKAYCLAHRENLRQLKGAEFQTVQKNMCALNVEVSRLKIALRIAQYVAATKSDDLPEPPNEQVDLGNGIFKPVMFCPEGLRIPRLKAWADDLYRSVSVSGQAGIIGEGLDIIRKLEEDGDDASAVLSEALREADAKPKKQQEAASAGA